MNFINQVKDTNMKTKETIAMLILAIVLVLQTTSFITDKFFTQDTLEIYTHCDIIYIDYKANTISFETVEYVFHRDNKRAIKTTIEALTSACVLGDYDVMLMYLEQFENI